MEEIALEGAALHLERSEAGDLVLPLSEEGRALLISEIEQDPHADLVPLPLQLDVARVADLRITVYDPVEDVASADVAVVGFELDGLHVAAREVSLVRVLVGSPAVLLDRGLIGGPRAMLRDPEAEADIGDGGAEESAVATPEATPVADVPTAPAAPSGPPPEVALPEVRIADLVIEDATLTWMDRTHEPPVREESKSLALEARDLVLSEQGLSSLLVRGQGLRGEPFELRAKPAEEGGMDFHLVAEFAIALLSGPDGRIHLNVPVSFDLDEEATRIALEDLEGSLQQAVQRSVGGTGAVTGGKGLRFDPIPAAPGDAELDANGMTSLETLAEVLSAKPSVAVTLRGVVAAADTPALAALLGVAPEAVSEAQLDALARGRALRAPGVAVALALAGG